jgi:hypothetical protein
VFDDKTINGKVWRSNIKGSVFVRSSRIDRGQSLRGRCARQVSTLPVEHQVKVDGSDKLKQGGHTVVDNWPWPGGHSTSSSPTLFMVGY